jgi:hypothetical protein
VTTYVPYGGTAADFLFTVVDGDVVPAAGGTAGVWTAATGGSALTDLLDASGAAATHVTADASGLVRFSAPTGSGTVFLDPGLSSGLRFACQPTDMSDWTSSSSGGEDDSAAVTALQDAVTGIDTTVANLSSEIGTVSTTVSGHTSAIAALQEAVAALQQDSSGSGGSSVAGPTGLTATPGNGIIDLTWTLGAGPGITGQYLHWNPAGTDGSYFANLSASATAVTISDLTNTESYTFTLAPVTDAGTGAVSTTVTSAPVAPTAPGVPTGLTATPGDGQVALAWTASTGDVTGYIARYRTSPDGAWTDVPQGGYIGTTVTVTGLTDGTAYDFDVCGFDSEYDSSAYTDPVTATPVAGGPPTASPPNDVTAVAGPGTGQITYFYGDDPTDNTAPITDHYVRWRQSPAGDWQGPGYAEAGGFPINGLTNGTPYDVEVAVLMGSTIGTWSAPATATPEASSSPSWQLPDALYADDFNRADGPIGSTDGGSASPVAWSGGSIVSHAAIASSPTFASLIDTGQVGGTYQATVAVVGDSVGLILRSSSNGGQAFIFRISSGSYQALYSGVAVEPVSGAPTPAPGDVLKVIDNGVDTITAFVNGVQVSQFAATQYLSNTLAGFTTGNDGGSITDWSYSTATSVPAPSWQLPSAYLADSFDRPDSASIGSTDGGSAASQAWQVFGSSTIGISDDTATATTPEAGATQTVINTGNTAGTHQLTLAAVGSHQIGIIFRANSDTSSHNSLCARETDYYFALSGVESIAQQPAVGDVLKVVDDGTTATAFINGVQVAQQSAGGNGWTLAGFKIEPTEGVGTCAVDDWSYSTATS